VETYPVRRPAWPQVPVWHQARVRAEHQARRGQALEAWPQVQAWLQQVPVWLQARVQEGQQAHREQVLEERQHQMC
jgi:hypothetical protein